LACPYFIPTQKWEGGTWAHPSRLPLGGGWLGHCSAPGHEGARPAEEEIKEFCNMGYAADCPRLPAERSCDAVRFSISRDDGSRLLLCFVCESAHKPTAYGTLEYDCGNKHWLAAHAEVRIQKLAECFLQSYLSRSSRLSTADSTLRANS